ncbi:MAG: hypothetical protein QXR45_15070 [Candidatus Bathyarchaeia archaeon]
MSLSVKCPVYGGEIKGKPSKEWSFRFYRVSRFECEKCKDKFNFYESSKPKLTIPKAKR